MKKFLTILGGVFLAVILLLVGLFGFVAYEGHGLDVSSKAYVEVNVPPIIATWSTNELLKRSSPQLLEVINKNPQQLDELFRAFSRLGAMKTFGDVKGESTVAVTAQDGKVITAAYSGTGKFAHGDAQISVRLIQNAGQWQLLSFNVNSPLLLQ